MQIDYPKKKQDPKPIQEVLQQNFQCLVTRIDLLSNLGKKLAAFLPPELAKETRVSNLQAGKLVLATNNSATATLLRYQQRNILYNVNQWFPNAYIRSVAIKVRVPTYEC